jgi:hypothetical protein
VTNNSQIIDSKEKALIQLECVGISSPINNGQEERAYIFVVAAVPSNSSVELLKINESVT